MFEKLTGQDLLILTFLFLVWLGLAYVIYRWIFSIDTQLSNQRKQIALLEKIVEKFDVKPIQEKPSVMNPSSVPLEKEEAAESTQKRKSNESAIIITLVIIVAIILMLAATGNI